MYFRRFLTEKKLVFYLDLSQNSFNSLAFGIISLLVFIFSKKDFFYSVYLTMFKTEKTLVFGNRNILLNIYRTCSSSSIVSDTKRYK